MTTKWISDGSVTCKEVPGTRIESYNVLSGTPQFNVRLEIPNGQWEAARSKLLGTPETWPHTTNFLNVRALTANLVADNGKYTTDSNEQIVLPNNPHFVDLIYAPRPGVYVEIDYEEDQINYNFDVYIEDALEPRNESHPLNPLGFIWGSITDTVPSDKTRTLAGAEAPVQYVPGDTITHTIEGWPIDTSALEPFVGTCNDVAWFSLNLKRLFGTGTLLLKNLQIMRGFTFQSYRAPGAVLPIYDYSGSPIPTVKFIYEYKKEGWQKYFRADPDDVTYPAGYYYIRHAKSPYDKFIQFPLKDHTAWLD